MWLTWLTLILPPLLLYGCARPVSRPFAAQAPRGIPADAFGLNHVITWGDGSLPDSTWTEKFRLAEQAGCRWVRVDACNLDEAYHGRWQRYERFLRLMPASMTALPIINLAPLSGPNEVSAVTARAFFNFVQRFRPEAVQIGNEPNNTPALPPELYARIVIAAATGIHVAMPQCRAVWGGLGSRPGLPWTPQDYLRRFHAIAGAADAYDIMAVHPYDKGLPFVQMAASFAPNKPLWITEDGYRRKDAWGPWEERRQADALRGSYAVYIDGGYADKLFWYALQSRGDERYNMLQGKPGAWRMTESYRAFQESAP